MQVAHISRWLAPTVLLALLGVHQISMQAVAATSSSTLTQANQSRALSEAEQLAAQGKFGEASSRFEALAAQASEAERDHLTLRAARYAQLAGNNSKAQGLLNLTGKNLRPADAALRAVTSAALMLAANQPQDTLNTLDQIPLPLPDELAADALAVRSEALFALNRPVLAVNAAVERERILKSDGELAQSRQLLWNKLKQLAAAGRDLSVPAGANRVTAGWLELAALYGNGSRDPFAFNRGLNEWRTGYPGHPGSTLLAGNNAIAIPRSGTEHLALLLPLSGKQQAAGMAVRDGFLAALLQQASTSRPLVEVFDTNEGGALAAYQHAQQAGASMIVGPLLKEDLDAIAASQQVGVMTLGLNVLSSERAPPALLFQFALDPEEEARQVAQRAHQEGRRRAILLLPNNEWGQRVQRAFSSEITALGDTLVEQRSYDAAARDYVGMAKQLFASRKPPQAKALEAAVDSKRPLPETRDDFDYIFVAAQATQAKQLRPALRFVLPDTSIPIYATSDSYEPEASNSSDLEGLRFVDMPWVINRSGDTANLYDAISRAWPSSVRNRSRLYAFGIDAFNLVSWLKTPQPQMASPLRGATGWLALDQSGRVRRQADWAQVINGKPQVLPDSGGR